MSIAFVLLLTTVQFVSLKGARVIITLFALELGAGPFASATLFALYGLTPFLFAVYAGRIADRFGNHVLIYAGLAGFAASLALPALFPTLPVLFVSSPLVGFTSMLFIVATQNMVGVLSTPATRTRNYANYSLTDATGNVVGPVLVGFAIDGFGHRAAYGILAAIALACLVLFQLGRRSMPGRAGAAAPARPPASWDLLRVPALRNAFITNGIVMAGTDLYIVYMPIHGLDTGLSASAIGLIMGSFGAAGFAARALIPPVTARWGEYRMITATLAISCIAYVVMPMTPDPWFLGVVSFFAGFGLGCGQPLAMILTFNAAPPGRSAEAIAMRLAVSYGSHVMIPPMFGALGAAAGVVSVFWTGAVLLAGGVAVNRRGRATK
jgi:MFS family permease